MDKKQVYETVQSLWRLEERVGYRRAQTYFVQYHYVDYSVCGVDGNLRFFQQCGLPLSLSNMVFAGRMDEPFFITHIGVNFITKSRGDDRLNDLYDVYCAGHFELVINNTRVFDVFPVGHLGSSFSYKELIVGGADIMKKKKLYAKPPMEMKSPLLIDEGVSFFADIRYDRPVCLMSAGKIGVELIGFKFFKR